MANSRKDAIVGRKVAVLVANNVDGATIDAVRKALEAGGAAIKLIASRLGEIKSSEGKVMKVGHSLQTV